MLHLLIARSIARSCRLPRCNSLDDKSNAQENSTYSVMLKFVLVPT